jgi:hypothetical protein
MRVAGLLAYLALVSAVFASAADRYTPTWLTFCAGFVVLMMASTFWMLAVMAAPKEEEQ